MRNYCTKCRGSGKIRGYFIGPLKPWTWFRRRRCYWCEGSGMEPMPVKGLISPPPPPKNVTISVVHSPSWIFTNPAPPDAETAKG